MSTLLSQGGFGCVFYPGLDCDKSNGELNKKTVTKIQKDNFFSKKESHIGKKILRIPNYIEHFVPISETCQIQIRKIEDKKFKKDIKKCEIISEQSKLPYVSMSMKYINGKGLLDLFDDLDQDNRIIISKLMSSYYHLLTGIEILQQNGIIHNDLKSDNVLFDLDSQLPKIIDFGISIEKEKLTDENLKDYFYAFGPEYFVWPIEVHIICYLLHEMPESFTEEMLHEIVRDHVEANKTYDDKIKMKKKCIQSLKKFIGNKSKHIINELLKMSKTWDNYALSIMFLRILRTSLKEKDDNVFFEQFDDLLTMNASPDFSERKSILETRIKFNELKDLNIKPLEYDKIIKTLNRTDSKKELVGDSIQLETIKEKYIKL